MITTKFHWYLLFGEAICRAYRNISNLANTDTDHLRTAVMIPRKCHFFLPLFVIDIKADMTYSNLVNSKSV